jgi:hypothetical protein
MAPDLKRKESYLEGAVNESERQSERVRLAADGADRLVDVLESKVEELVRKNPQILERMSPEERQRFESKLAGIKKRTAPRG